jgi:protein tyrosine phosphatase domain-containing protein 1
MTTPSLDVALNVVQVMDSLISGGGKVALHCHAGLGRTGLMIACYLVYAEGLTPEKAIEHIRHRRKKSVQTSKQHTFLQQFQAHVQYLRQIFPSKPDTLSEVFIKQERILHGTEVLELRFIPKV